jgi:NAD(P)H-dependent flavin oxidoreductase YrpB (nitropropane dioxygenase family)
MALPGIELTLPIIAAPMAGGPTTPALVVAAARAGGLGFLAGGYQTADALARQIDAVRQDTSVFGVNLFAPNPLPVDSVEYARYRKEIQVDADRFGVSLPERPIEDDDLWRDKIDVLLDSPAPVVSFTFGLPKVAAGGLVDPDQVAAVIKCCAQAVMVGTALLLAPESGTSAAHRNALSNSDCDTVVTRAFTGRPARALPNAFLKAHNENAPLGYPAVHHLTRPIRRAGDPDYVNLWAGTGYRSAVELPAAQIMRDLTKAL